ncbi:hypothetical protein [uncultured Maribacter sp.]|uniref:hypothetical protein n=1 Tax=uncultured Maribacter sp. TaxID=431308 RepID=UPI0026125170|nr:hypothetical protein [uncultured Maribacter sp.]
MELKQSGYKNRMKRITLLITLLILLNCKSKNEFEGQFLSAIETTTLDVNGNEIEFNVAYTVEFEQTEKQDCLVESKDELNSMLIEPLIRSVIRGFVGRLDKNEIETIDKEDVKDEINKELSEGDISLNSNKFVSCPVRVSTFAITKRN